MKKRILIAGVVLIFISSIFIAEILHLKTPDAVSKKKDKEATEVSKEFYKPDMELLDYYGLGDFNTTLPVIHINTNGEQIVKDTKIWANLAILNKDENGVGRNVSEQPDIDFPITIKLRGASSYVGFGKNQYRIEFYKEVGKSKSLDYKLLGMKKHSKWVLNGPFLDFTMLRNHIIYKASREIFEWAPQSEFCEVFVDGKYQGIYIAVEAIENGESRLNLKTFGLLTGETSYILKRDRVDSDENAISTYGEINGKTYNSLYISYPSYRKITTNQKEWITNDVNKFEKALYSDDFADSEKGYAKYIDYDNFVDYFILNEVVMNRDAGNLSTYIYKDLGGKLKFTVWDYNNAYDNYQGCETDYREFRMHENSWFDRLLEDRSFVDRIVLRYGELRKTTLNNNSLYADIDMFQKEIEKAVERNFTIWGYMFKNNIMNDSDRMITSYEMAIDQLKQTIDKRFVFLDNHIEDLYSNCIN